MRCGIMGLGVYLPEHTMDAEAIARASGIPQSVIVEKFGITQKTAGGEKDTPSYMGIAAAQNAIQDAGITPEEIDVVIWVGDQHKDYRCWLAGVKVAHALGAHRAWAFDMSAMCGSMIAGMEVAQSLMVAQARYRTILLVSGFRMGDLVSLQDSTTSFMYDMADGGAAMILRKNHTHNAVLGTAIKVDGDFSEDCVMEYGGAKHWPIQAEHLAHMHMHIPDPERFKEKLKAKTMQNFYAVIEEAMQQSHMGKSDIDYLAMLHIKKSAHLAVLKELNLREDQTTYLSDYGHMGQNDQVLSIALGLKKHKIQEGDHVVMVGSGLGFVWAAAVVKWGAIA